MHEQWEGRLTGATNRGIVDVRAWHDGSVGSNAEGDARESGGAGEDITALRAAVFRAGYFGIVCGDCSRREVEESSSCISDGVDRC